MSDPVALEEARLSFSEGGPDDIEDLKPLFQAEFNEVGEEGLELDIDYALLSALLKIDRAVIYLVRKSGKIVGYSVWTLGPHPKYRGTSWAFGAGLWLDPTARCPRAGHRLISYSEMRLKERGVQFVQAGSRSQHGAAGRLLQSCGYSPYEIGWLRRLT